MQKDMTTGKPMKMLLNFTIPVFLGSIFQQLYSMIDAIIVGQFVGTKALAAVGATGTITFLILGFLMGITTGVTVLTSQKFGAGMLKEMRRTVGNAVIISFGTGGAITLISMLGMRKLLTIMQTPVDIFEDAYTYIMIICAGIFAQVLYNLCASILRALGNSKVPLYFLIVSAALNVILDLVFIVVFKIGVAGAAWATVISQGISGFLCLGYIIKCVPELKLEKDDWKFRKNIALNQVRIGIPMGLQFSITAIGSIMVQSSLNRLGSFAVAAFTAGLRIENIFGQAFPALGTALSTYNAQNIGAGDLKRVREGFKAAHIMGIIYAVITGLFLIFFGKYLAYLFISDNADVVVPLVDIFVKSVGLFFIPLHFVNSIRNGIQGMGYGMLPMMSGVAELVGRGATAIAAASFSSYVGVCMASPAAWIIATALLFFMYHYVMKDMEKKLKFDRNL